MKKQLFMAICLTMTFFACKKENANPRTDTNNVNNSNGKVYAVGFNLTGFTAETKGLSTNGTGKMRTAALSDVIKYFSYYVYKGDADSLKFVKKIDQASTDSDFGTIQDSLANGHYTIFFVGSKSPDYYVSNSYVDVVEGTYHPALSFTDNKFGDTFAKKLEIDVTGPQTESVVLKRIVGMITFKLKDVIPNNMSKAVFTVLNAVPAYDLVAEGPAYNGADSVGWDERVQTINVKQSDKGQTNVEFSIFVWPHSGYQNPQLEAFDANNVLLGSKRIEDPQDMYSILDVQSNKQYIYTGYLFSTQTSGFTASVDSTWNAPQTIDF
ncbi:hypothetical protein IM792_20460 [Mucilaginibacter sp. JRF]|uniref:hypothetical protein n=1 Tax=Mucilaginibacter sp. JRF TaxID=2780088 RepID=UPI0018808501|nr:hypothetical protein [Mucilaginibacter sp. JRF]MBE9586833.1 hypothetical protein [Mucilaginibacter sp. JRF]